MKKFFTIAIFLCSYSFLGQDKSIGQIPFTINNDGLMIITLQINNEEVSNFVLDTGASVTVIDDDIATQLGLQLKDGVFQSTGTNAVMDNRRMTQKQRVSLHDEIALKGLEIMVIDLSHLDGINGLIGFDLFKEYITETNFDTKVISFYKRKSKPDTTGYQSIDFVESFCTPEIDVSVIFPNDESFSGKVTFDTGNVNTPLIFNTPFVNKNNISSKLEVLITYKSDSKGINSGFKTTTTKGVISSLRIKNFKLSEIPIALSSTKEGMLSKEAYMGNLGLEYISKFNFILDYNKKKIYLKPNTSYQNPFRFPLSGIGLETNKNGIFIKSIAQPSMAFEKGLKVGQQLISINGIKGKEVSFYKNILKKENEKVSIVVKLENGTLQTVEILLTRLI